MIPRTTVDIGNEELKAIKRVVERKQFVKGIECQLLEKEFAQTQGVKHGAAVNSGTSALYLSLLALGVQPGDEIITVPNTFAATINSLLLVGARPVFTDIDPETFTMDVSNLQELITSKTKAILPVHLYGLMSEMKPISEIAGDNGIFIVEDACQAHGAEYHGKMAGEIGDIAAFSFFPTKNTTVAGDGGIVLSNDEELIDKIKILRDHGRKGNIHICAGFNNRLSELLAAIGRENLKKLPTYNEHRRKIAKFYNEYLGDCEYTNLPIEPNGFKHVYHLFTIKAERRNRLQEFLKRNQIESKVMYSEKLNELDYVRKIAGMQKTPTNDNLNKKILSLPISGTLPFQYIEVICSKVKEFYKNCHS